MVLFKALFSAPVGLNVVLKLGLTILSVDFSLLLLLEVEEKLRFGSVRSGPVGVVCGPVCVQCAVSESV